MQLAHTDIEVIVVLKQEIWKQTRALPDAYENLYEGYLPSGFQQSAVTCSAEESRRTSTSIHRPPEPLGKALKE